MQLLLGTMDRMAGWSKTAHLQVLHMQGKWKGRYAEAVLFDMLRLVGMLLAAKWMSLPAPRPASWTAAGAAIPAVWEKLRLVWAQVRLLAWFCFGHVWFAEDVRQRHLIAERFKRAWRRFQETCGDEEAWVWNPNGKNLANFFLCSILITTDMRLNNAAIIEQMHREFMKVRAGASG